MDIKGVTKTNETKLDKELNDKLKNIVDEVEDKVDCSGGYSLKIGKIYDGKAYELYLQFGYDNYFFILKPASYEKSIMLTDITDYKFSLIEADILYDNIKKLIKEIVKNHNNKIKNKEEFLKKVKK